MIESIYIYKLLAALLVTNSHMDLLYGRLNFLAIGGALGNTFFFIASGFLASKKKTTFFSYMRKRVSRIWPAVIVVTLFMYVLGELPEYGTIGEVLLACLFPTTFWFVNAVIVCYILFYFTDKYFERYLNVIIGVFILCYVVFYLFIFDLRNASLESGYGKVLYLFPAMLIGKKMRSTYDTQKRDKHHRWGLVFVLGVIWMVLQLLAKKYPLIQIMTPFSAIALGVAFLHVLLCNETKIAEILAGRKSMQKIIHEIANATLEIYLVQILIIRSMSKHTFNGVAIVTFILIFATAVLLRKAVNNNIFKKVREP